MEMRINIYGIETSSVVDGPGVRFAVFLQGCSHNCSGCHNPESHDPDKGKIELLSSIKNQIIKSMMTNLRSGITLSGGDPLYPDNRLAVLQLLKWFKSTYQSRTVWMYTGYSYEDVSNEEILKYVDVLVDGRYDKSLRTLTKRFKGSSNQRIIDVQRSLNEGSVVILDGYNE